MIDLSRLRSIKTLESMKKDLEFFVKEPIIKEIYDKEYDWDENDYDADREEANYLIDLINLRIKSLSKMKNLNPPKEKNIKKEPEPTPSVETVEKNESESNVDRFL